MKKAMLTLLAAVVLAALPAQAQTDSVAKKETLGQRFSRLTKKAVKNMERTAHGIGDAIGFDDRLASDATADSVKIDGIWYMPIYDVNLYKGADLDVYLSASRHAFAERYPGVTIERVVVPQQEWVSETYRKNNKVVGYRQTLYCYVLARDADDGYVNARFMFQRSKEPGRQYRHVEGRWPEWQRTDIIPMGAYEKLKAK